MRSITPGQLAPRHISALRAQLVGALAMGWALGGCDEQPRDEYWREYVSATVEPPPSLPEPGECPYGDAGAECYSVERLNALVGNGDGGIPDFLRESAPEPTFTAEGCIDSRSAQFVELRSCGPYTVGVGTRRDDQCCYRLCYGSPGCGRPFVVEGAARVAASRESPEWASVEALAGAGETHASAAIAREWLRDALAEHASVAAFSAFNLSLLALGAPADLVRASAAATLDEVAHARACFELASDYAGRSLGPGALALDGLQIATDLASTAERAFLDGCIGETAAALGARASLDACDSPRVRAVLERIAEDEARHAELAWRFIAWALRRGGEPIARVLQAALLRAAAGSGVEACCASAAAPPEWHRAGRLSDAERARITEGALRDIARPMLQGLLAQRASTRGAPVGVASVA